MSQDLKLAKHGVFTNHYTELCQRSKIIPENGFCFRKFISKFSVCTAPLFAITKKILNFVGHLSVKLSLSIIKINCRTHLFWLNQTLQGFSLYILTHLSEMVLVQIHDGELKPIMFGGPVLTDTETKYATLDRKLLAYWLVGTQALHKK